jgi:hypothetical protein
MSLSESKYGSGSDSDSIYNSDDSIISIKSNESYTTNQEGTDWCAAHSTSRLLAKLLIPKNTSPQEYKKIGLCLFNLFTQNLQQTQPFLYDSFIHDVIGKINNKSFNSELECFQKLNKYLRGVKFKVMRLKIITPITIPNKPAILSIGGTKDFFDTFNGYKASTADRTADRTIWDEYNAKNPTQCNKPFGHSLFLKSYNKNKNTLHIKDSDGYDYFDIPLDLILPAIKEIIYLKKFTKSLKGGKTQQVIKKTRKNKNKKAFR